MNNKILKKEIKEIAEIVVDNYRNNRKETTVFLYNDKLDVQINKQSIPQPLYDETADLVIEFENDELSEMFYSYYTTKKKQLEYVTEKITEQLKDYYKELSEVN